MTGPVYRTVAFFLLVSSVATLAFAQSPVRKFTRPVPHSPDAPKYVPGELLVKYRPGMQSAAAALNARVAARLERKFTATAGLQLVRVPPTASMRAVLHTYRANPAVEYAEPNYLVKLSGVTPTDPGFQKQWAMNNTGQLSGVPGADIKALAAWDLSTGSSSVVVATLDTGIDYTHPDLLPNLFRNTADCNSNGVDDDGDGYIDDCYGINTDQHTSDPMDDHGHGTHVAGIIGAAANNGTGIVGVNWNVQVLSCKFLNSSGYGSVSGAVECLDWIRRLKQRGVNIVASNNSWGGMDYSQALADAVKAQQDAGILFIAAAGNDFSDNDLVPTYPADLPASNLIAVAATNRFDDLASFSNVGKYSVHLGAPGDEILSTLPGGTYGYLSGTSMAAPFVTGAAALLAAQDPARDWKSIRNLILAGGDSIPGLASTITGRRLNVYGALACSNSAVTSRIEPAGEVVSMSVASPVTIAVENINCAKAAGELTASVPATGDSITLKDDGISPDQVTGDGIYTGQWTPLNSGLYTVDLPGGDHFAVNILANYFPEGTLSNYQPITGQSLDLSDDAVAELTTPFPITVGGARFSKLYISSNGTISLTDAFSEYYNRVLPLAASYTPYGWSRDANLLLAPWWDDLYPVAGSTQNVYWAITGTAPNRQLIVEWRDVRFYDCRTDPNATVRFEAIFTEGSNDIDYEYAKVAPGCLGHDFGASATVGLQTDAHDGSSWSFMNEQVSSSTGVEWRLLSEGSTPNPVPVLYRVNPSSVAENAGQVSLTVTGANFVPGAQVQFLGSGRATTFVSSTQLTATLHSFDTVGSGLWPITVVNPAPGGGTSNPMNLGVAVTPPQITSLSPSSAVAGGPAFTLTIKGQDLNSYSAWVRFGATPHTPTIVDDSTWQADISASEIANPGTVNVQIGDGPGGPSNLAQFTITAPAGGSNLPVQNNGQGAPVSLQGPRRFLGWQFGARIPSYTQAFATRGYQPGGWTAGGASVNSLTAIASSTAAAVIPAVVAHPSMPAGFIPTAVAVGDFNGDGHQDWAVTSGGDSTLWLYFGKGDGTAAPPLIVPLMGSSPTAVVAADLRGTGVPDLIVAEADSLALEVLLNDGKGSFTSGGQQFVPGLPITLTVGDYNRDGHTDVAAGMLSLEGFGAVAVCPGDGSGRLRNPLISQDDSIWFNYATLANASADFDNDGTPDLVMVYGTWGPYFGFGPIGTRVFLNDGAGRFKPGVTLFPASSFDMEVNVAAGDLNRDGCADVVGIDAYGVLRSYLGHCDGTFAPSVIYPEGDVGAGAALADVNGDGILDAITTGAVTGQGGLGYGYQSGQLLSVMIGDGQGGFAAPAVYRGGTSAFSLATADLNGDGKIDVVTADQDSDSSTQFLNDGSGGFGYPSGGYIGYLAPNQTAAVNQPASDVTVLDVNGDGRPDLLWLTSAGTTTSSTDATVVLNQGQGSYGPPLHSPLVRKPSYGMYAFAAGDFRHTGRQDLVFIASSEPGSGPFYVFAGGNGDGTFTPGTPVATDGAQPLAVTQDFNGDGNLDFVTVYACQSVQFCISVFAGHGDGTFVEQPAQLLSSDVPVTTYVTPGYAYAADFNHDGKMDILCQLFMNQVPYRDHNLYLLAGNGDATFQPPRQVLANLGQIQLADLDHDGNLDLIESKNGMQYYPDTTLTSLNVYLGKPDGSFAPKYSYPNVYDGIPYMQNGVGLLNPSYGGAGWLADFDGDGNLDIAAVQQTASLPMKSYVQFMHGNGDGTFTPGYGISPLGGLAVPSQATDFRGSGHADLIEFDGYSSVFQILPVVSGANLSGRFLPQPIPGTTAILRLNLSSASAATTTVSLVASDPNLQLPSSVAIAAGQLQADVPVTLGPGFSRSQVFAVTAASGNDSVIIYGVPAINPASFKVWAQWQNQTVLAGIATNNYGLGAQSVGGYATDLTVTCEGLPAGANCQLTPAQFTLPAGGLAGVSAVVRTDPTLAQGTYKFAAVFSDGVTTVRQPLSLAIGDFSLQMVNSTNNMYEGGAAWVGVSVQGSNGYSGTVSLSCTGLPSTITCNPTMTSPGGVSSLWIYSQGAPVGTYPFTVVGTSGGAQRSVAAALRVIGITGSITPGSASLRVGQSSSFTLTINAPAGFYEPLNLVCSAPSGIACTLGENPVNFAAGTTAKTIQVTIQANALPTSTASVHPARSLGGLLAVVGVSGLALAGIIIPGRAQRRALWMLLVVVVLGYTSCGGGGGSSSPSPSPAPPPAPPPPTSKQVTITIQGQTGAPSLYVKDLGKITLTVSQ